MIESGFKIKSNKSLQQLNGKTQASQSNKLSRERTTSTLIKIILVLNEIQFLLVRKKGEMEGRREQFN